MYVLFKMGNRKYICKSAGIFPILAKFINKEAKIDTNGNEEEILWQLNLMTWRACVFPWISKTAVIIFIVMTKKNFQIKKLNRFSRCLWKKKQST